ncbi:MAG: hypothetical protein PHN84_09330 [Desulfuromonadaceae bacterium]|nr:hypothetical protein [Desulfuromonadaceae bacterium]MDD2854093.1 hypothetical protein [Desulfuromonadaceae bacterium]
MKKIILASLLVVMAATSSFSATDSTVVFDDAGKNVAPSDGTTVGTAVGRLSASDALGFIVSTSGYTLITQHLQGTRSFGTAHDGTAIFWAPETKGTGHAKPDTLGVTYFATGWTTM